MDTIKLSIISLLFFPSLSLGEGLIGFLCGGDGIPKTSVSLVQTPSCTLSNSTKNITQIHLILTQTEQLGNLKASFCKVIANHLITRCGPYYDGPVNNGFFTEFYEVNKSVCSSLIQEGYFKPPSQSGVILQLPRGSFSGHQSYQSWGYVSESGSCTAGPPLKMGNGELYDRPLRSTNLEFQYGSVDVKIDYENDEVIFPNGNRCQYSANHCTTPHYGNIFWDTLTPTCESENEKTIVYRGPGNMITVKNGQISESYVQVSQGGYDFQLLLILSPIIFVCNVPSYKTEHKRLFVTVLQNPSQQFPIKRKNNPDGVSLIDYINSKTMYSMRHTRDEVNRLFDLFVQDRCETQNRITHNMLTLAITSPREFAYQYFKSPGYTAITHGEVVHIVKCKPVGVIPHITDSKCHDELPVLYNNKTWFLTPRNHILINVGTEIPCSAGVPSAYFINNRWVSPSLHGLIPITPPSIMTQDVLHYNFEVLSTLASGGLYTDSEMETLQKILITPLEEPVLSTRLVNAMGGNGDLPEGYQITNAFSATDYDRVKNGFIGWLSGLKSKVIGIGNMISFIIGLVFTIRIIVGIMNGILNFFLLKRHLGLCSALSWFWWDSYAHHLIGKTTSTTKSNFDNGSQLSDKFNKDKNEENIKENTAEQGINLKLINSHRVYPLMDEV